jgi:hypothetical protein
MQRTIRRHGSNSELPNRAPLFSAPVLLFRYTGLT